MNKKIIKNRRFEEEEACWSSSVEDVTFISDYFAWCLVPTNLQVFEQNPSSSSFLL
jgi:hypothetical protein